MKFWKNFVIKLLLYYLCSLFLVSLMNALRKYDIAFNGLGTGTHSYKFHADDAFFEAHEGSEIKKGTAEIDVKLTKAANALILDFGIKGVVIVECDRCLDDCEIPVDYGGQLVVKFSETEMDETEKYDGEMLWINPNEGVINIAQYIYESIVLGLPFQRVHPNDENGKQTCNEDMLKRFHIVTEEEFEELITHETQEAGSNPEFEKLKKLKESLK